MYTCNNKHNQPTWHWDNIMIHESKLYTVSLFYLKAIDGYVCKINIAYIARTPVDSCS